MREIQSYTDPDGGLFFSISALCDTLYLNSSIEFAGIVFAHRGAQVRLVPGRGMHVDCATVAEWLRGIPDDCVSDRAALVELREAIGLLVGARGQA